MNKRRRSNKWIVGGIVIVATIVGISFLSLNSYSVYFYTPDEAFAQAATLHDRDIRVGGMVKASTVRWMPANLDLSFILTDFKGHEMNVSYRGTPPDMFKENAGVVIEGRISADAGSFTAKNLMAKHSEEYKAPDANHSVDKELLEKSIFKK